MISQVEILLPTSSSKVFPDMLEALESSQVIMAMVTMTTVNVNGYGDVADGDGDDDGDGDGDIVACYVQTVARGSHLT